MYARKRIQHAFVDRLDNSVPRVTVWHHSSEPRDAKQWYSGQNCLSYPQTHDRFSYSTKTIPFDIQMSSA